MASLEGVLILSVQKNSPAEAMGIRPNDVIISLGAHRVTDVTELSAEVLESRPGEGCEAIVWRDGRYHTVSGVVGRLVVGGTEEAQEDCVVSD